MRITVFLIFGTNGRVNDAREFSKSSFYEALENKLLKIPSNRVFVADDAFPFRNYMLKPYSRIRRLTTTPIQILVTSKKH